MWRNPRWWASSNAFQTASTPGYWSAYVFSFLRKTKGKRHLPSRYRRNRQWFSLCILQRIFLPVVLWLAYRSCDGKSHWQGNICVCGRNKPCAASVRNRVFLPRYVPPLLWLHSWVLFYLTDAWRAEPVFRLFHTVQRIAYPQPIDREIIIGTENPVTEHRIIEVPEFDQDTATRCFLCEMFEHIAKDFFCLFFVGRKRLIQKFTFAIYYAMFH